MSNPEPLRFSLVHPSRQRLRLAEDAIREWHANASGRHAIEHLLSVDDDDPDLPGYRELAQRLGVQLVVGPNHSLVEAVNRAAARTQGDLIVVVSDDFGCPPEWDRALADAAGDRRDIAVLVADGYNDWLMTLPVLGRELHARLGYIYHPAYTGLFADTDLTNLTHELGVLIDARHLLFSHRHYSFGLAEADATYFRHNEPLKYWQGWRMFEKRRAVRFGLDRPSLSTLHRQLRVDVYYLLRTGFHFVRGIWLRRLPARWRGAEEKTHTFALKVLRRITGSRV